MEKYTMLSCHRFEISHVSINKKKHTLPYTKIKMLFDWC